MNNQRAVRQLCFPLSLAAADLMLASSCGHDCDHGPDSCEEMVQALLDCDPDLSSSYPEEYCATYNAYDCDLYDYYICVSAAMGECIDGSFPDMDSTAISDCASLAVCT